MAWEKKLLLHGIFEMRYEFTNVFSDESGIYTIEINSTRGFEKYMVFDMNSKNIFKTNSREELKIWMDLFGLKFEKALIKYKNSTFLTKCTIYCERNWEEKSYIMVLKWLSQCELTLKETTDIILVYEDNKVWKK